MSRAPRAADGVARERYPLDGLTPTAVNLAVDAELNAADANRQA
jgi:hypothetical protein